MLCSLQYLKIRICTWAGVADTAPSNRGQEIERSVFQLPKREQQ